jgi:hypothetical protein
MKISLAIWYVPFIVSDPKDELPTTVPTSPPEFFEHTGHDVTSPSGVAPIVQTDALRNGALRDKEWKFSTWYWVGLGLPWS